MATMNQTKMDILRAVIGNEHLRVLVKTTGLAIATYYATKWFLNMLDPSKARLRKNQSAIKELLDSLEITTELNEYEMVIASFLIDPKSISVSWNDIAGMEEVRDQIFYNVVVPLRSVNMHKKSHLYQPPKGSF